MKERLITIWANKNNNLNWLEKASKVDCRHKEGYEKVSYIGFNIKISEEYTSFDYENVFNKIVNTKILTKNVVSITKYNKKNDIKLI